MGVTISAMLEIADTRLGITNRVIAGLDEMGDSAANYIAQKKRQALSSTGKAVDEVIDYAVESARAIAVTWIRRTLRAYLSPFPRVK